MRTTPRPEELPVIDELLRDTGMFRPDELEIAREVFAEGLEKPDTTYRYLLLDDGDTLVGVASFGPIPCTVSSWDLYWIAVRKDRHGLGLGRRLLRAAEDAAAALGATRMYVDTSGRPDYGPTRAFYEGCGYSVAAHLPDFYAPGDAKVVFCRAISA